MRIADIEHLAEAAEFAYWLGTPLNRFCSINASMAGIEAEGLHGFLTIFLARARQWVLSNRGTFHYLYVIENKGGLNIHILMHVPPTLLARFLRLQRGWLKNARAKRIPPRTIMTEPVPKHSNDPHYWANLDYTLSYMVKGADPEACFAYGINHVPQGAVRGQRRGTSQSLDVAARAKMGFPSPWPRVVLRMNRLVLSERAVFERTSVLE